MDKFLHSCCEVQEEYEQGSGELYAYYRKWCICNREYIHSTKDFYGEIAKRGFSKKRKNRGNFIIGLRLINKK